MTALHYTVQFGLASIIEKVLATIDRPVIEIVNALDGEGNGDGDTTYSGDGFGKGF